MLRGDWFKRHSITVIGAGITALLIATALLAINWGFSMQFEYERYADENRKEYTANTFSPERQRCFRLAAGLQHACITEARNEATAYSREQQDLVAQRVTALWTKLMGGAAIVGMILSAFGVFLVWTTFRATREANEISREIGNKQLRAYVGVDSILLDCPSVNIPNYQPAPISAGADIADFVVLSIQNFGATPANKVHTWVNWIVIPYPQSLPLNFDYPDQITPLPQGVEISIIETSLFPSQKYTSKVAMTDVNPVILSNAKMAFVYFYGRIVYTDITNTERHTYFCFRHRAGRQPSQEMERYRDHNYAT